jgi:hypothetical protein
MTPADTAELLVLAAAFDRRTIGEADVAAWHAALGDLEPSDVKAAIIAHYQDTSDWLMPSHVRTRVKAARAKRLALVVDQVPDADPDDVPAYLSAVRDQRYRAASADARPRPIRQLLAGVEAATVIE